MRLFFKLSAVLFAVAILILSLQPASNIPGPQHADKVSHALAYAALTCLTALGWPKLRLFRVVMMVTVFGIGVEIAQGLGGQGRMPSVLDALANFFGASVSALIMRFFRQ